ncbi:MAG: hypothetical protein JWQ99_2638 [Blastococcus sp.]|jgi:hypothetical protein|nr:hypothetical protein [Blastococcus sp.]
MRKFLTAVVVWPIALVTFAGPASANGGPRTQVFGVRFQGLVAEATWTTCPSLRIGAICTDTTVMAFDATTTEWTGAGPPIRSRGPVLRTLTFVYRVVGGEFGTVPVAEWFGRTETAAVSGTPRLTRSTAGGTVPISVCTVSDPDAGVDCPPRLSVDLTWSGTGPLTRVSTHTVDHGGSQTRMTWLRGRERVATVTGRVGGTDLGTLQDSGLARVDQGETVVQHPVD